MLKPDAEYFDQNIEFMMNGFGHTIKLLVKRMRVFGDNYVFECEPGQDSIWKNLKGGVQHVKRSNLQFV